MYKWTFKLDQLTSSLVKILVKYQLKNEVTWANFDTSKRIYNWQPFVNKALSASKLFMFLL